ncbi:hypothetical protein GCM10007939_22230 [Amylibacter marinus]|uniref:Uncharacterized protein n=1 Tax=Amylibacter marinus TaxID=1475483 RepID=A0ABQ5VXJ5_9RHOB|nr:hypothetical protein [Amylibacter marinus]GLQ35939.1 hypothetical protein GCM10007939_22230 [Amylibacter marinus]
MTFFTRTCAILMIVLQGQISFAADPIPVPMMPFQAWESDRLLLTDEESEDLLEKLIAAYGDEVVTSTNNDEFVDVAKAGTDEPAAYILRPTDGVAVFGITGQELPEALVELLLETFPDYTEDDFSRYPEGVTVIMAGAGVQINVFARLFKRITEKESYDLLHNIKLKLNETEYLDLPDTTEFLSQFNPSRPEIPDGLQAHLLFIPKSAKEVVPLVQEIFEKSGYSYSENRTDGGLSIRFTVDPQTRGMFAIQGEDEDGTIMIVRVFNLPDR